MTFGQRLKALRTEKCLTQLELAHKVNLSKANISKYESDNIEPNLDTLNLFSELFDVSLDFLLGKSAITKQEMNLQSDTELMKKQKLLLESARQLTKEEMEKVMEYVDLIKKARTP